MFGEFCKVCLLFRIKPLTSARGCFTEFLPVYHGQTKSKRPHAMRRFLIGLTLTLLLIVSIGVGVAVALWPSWRHVLQ
jgi:hypothetical protein